jgi:hypothetical protein
MPSQFRTNRPFLTALAAAVALSACAASPAQIADAARVRAAFDLGCPAASLATTPLGDTNVIGRTPQSPGLERSVVGVTGCGKKAVYVVECVSAAGSTCNAILNADAQRAP